MRLVIADDSVLLREGLARLMIESGLTVCASVGDVPSLFEAVASQQPDVAVVDVRMPPTFTHEGAAAALTLRASHPGVGILLLSQAVETHFAAQLIDRGVEGFGYLLKDRVIDVQTLVNALDIIAAGGTVIDPQVVRGLLGAYERTSPLQALTEREREVLALMAEGRSNTAIAQQLVISTKTIESHIARIFVKLDLHDEPDTHRRVLAVVTALRARADRKED